jgi:hypothetical protein
VSINVPGGLEIMVAARTRLIGFGAAEEARIFDRYDGYRLVRYNWYLAHTIPLVSPFRVLLRPYRKKSRSPCPLSSQSW